MKVLLTALNAKYIHSSLALRSLKAYADPEGNIRKNPIISGFPAIYGILK